MVAPFATPYRDLLARWQIMSACQLFAHFDTTKWEVLCWAKKKLYPHLFAHLLSASWATIKIKELGNVLAGHFDCCTQGVVRAIWPSSYQIVKSCSLFSVLSYTAQFSSNGQRPWIIDSILFGPAAAAAVCWRGDIHVMASIYSSPAQPSKKFGSLANVMRVASV